MNGMVKRIKEATARRVAYHRTVREIQLLPPSVAEDIGVAGADARTLARKVVYG